MRLLKLAAIALVASPLALSSGTAVAATAHNSQAGGVGASKNASDSTASSRHVKHAAKHKRM